jgi:hypothetical protein
MKLIRGLLDYSTPWTLPDIYIFTGNGIIKNNGAIVMGRGAAKQVRDSYPGIDRKLGQAIFGLPNAYYLEIPIASKQHIGWFKVKNHWQQPADLNLIALSTLALINHTKFYPIHTYHMNFPGVGNGRLSDKQVMPIIESLPDNVIIYR